MPQFVVREGFIPELPSQEKKIATTTRVMNEEFAAKYFHYMNIEISDDDDSF